MMAVFLFFFSMAIGLAVPVYLHFWVEPKEKH